MNARRFHTAAVGVLMLVGTLVPTSLPVRAAAAGAVRLVADLNLQVPPAAKPSQIVAFGGTVIYVGEDTSHGKELWKVDPVSGKAVFVSDIRSGELSSSPTHMTVVGPVAYFSADNGINGRELWKTDGTSGGTVIVKDICPGGAGSDPVGLVNIGGTLYFEANDGTHGRELWKSDGTQVGTTLVKDINPGKADGLMSVLDYYTSDLTAFDGAVFFAANDGIHGWELWKSDGTEAGTVLFKDINPGAGDSQGTAVEYTLYYPDLEVVGSSLFFIANDGTSGYELWKSDGTEAGTALVKDIEPGPGGALLSWPYPSSLTAMGAYVFFVVEDTAHGWALFRSDGTAAGTVMLLDTWNPSYDLTSVNGVLYFGDWGSNRLWKTDGTPAGTSQVSSAVDMPDSLTNVNGTLFFRGLSSSHGWELWKSDGTGAGTVEVQDIYPGLESSMPISAAEAPYWFTVSEGTLYFKATSGTQGYGLWRSDGTASGTQQVLQETGITLGSNARQLTRMGSSLYFVADDGVHGYELWKSDGTEAGTVLVKDITAATTGDGPSRLTPVGSMLYFVADDGIVGHELWKSDGTEAGTTLVRDITPGTSGFGPSELTAVGNTLYFVADDGDHGFELWKSDGTAAGTTLVADANPGAASSFPYDLTEMGGVLYFSGTDDVHGTELWRSDGTAAGTVMIKDINPGPDKGIYYEPAWFTVVGTTLFFVATDGVHGSEIWRTDGTEGGTVLVKDINPGSAESWLQQLTRAGGALFFTASDGVNGTELWRSDGTEAGTVMAADIRPGAESSWPSNLTAVGDVVAFVADDGVHGEELWMSGGSAEGTFLVADLHPGSPGSSITSLTAVGSRLYFAADDGTSGKELYRAVASTPSVTLVEDIAAGAGSSSPRDLTFAGDKLFFVADDNMHGEELWVADVNTAPVAGVDVTTIAVDEGQIAINTGTFSDADGDPVTLSASRGAITVTGDGAWRWQLTTSDGPDQSGQVTVTARDALGATSSVQFDLSVANVAPHIGTSWTVDPAGPAPVGTSVTVHASVIDPGTADTFVAVWQWGDGTQSSGTVTRTVTNIAVDGTHSYAAPGAYTVALSVADDDGGTDSASYQYVPVYDSSGGSVSGGGWILSPAGALSVSSSTAKAIFGLTARYRATSAVPSGNAVFTAPGVDFSSTAFTWLVISGPKAMLRGTGTLKGTGGASEFLLSAIDGQVLSKDGQDTFRMKIWDKATGAVVYDNQRGAPDDAMPTTAVKGGSIAIQK